MWGEAWSGDGCLRTMGAVISRYSFRGPSSIVSHLMLPGVHAAASLSVLNSIRTQVYSIHAGMLFSIRGKSLTLESIKPRVCGASLLSPLLPYS